MSKLDPALLGIVARRQKHQRRARPAFTASAEPAAAVVQIMVKFTGDVDDLRSAGFQPRSQRSHPSEGWTIASGSIPVDRVTELDGIDHVVKVEGSRAPRAELDRSVREIRASQLHNAPMPYRGAGVVIGVIDFGIDWRHGTFRRPDGTSRIVGIWDQTLEAEAGERPPFAFPNLGVEYTADRINLALTHQPEEPAEHDDDEEDPAPVVLVRTRDDAEDDGGHGTHVAGIAAGDGSQADRCSGAFTFVGVAPEAEIIVVVLDSEHDRVGESANLVDALEFIWNHPRVLNEPGGPRRPVVINMSLGDNLGPHDGTSLVEEWIDLDLMVTTGHVVIKSAGNEGNRRHHAVVRLDPDESRELPVRVLAGDEETRYAEMWYPGGHSVRVAVVAPKPVDAVAPESPDVDPGESEEWTVDETLPTDEQTDVRIDSRVDDPGNGDNSIHIELSPGLDAPLPAGRWKLRLTNTGDVATTIDIWLERGTGSPRFTEDDAEPQSTISIPGTAYRVITVGSYAQGGFLFFDSTGKVADSSSRGPTRDGRTKPEISAPGVAIKSAKAHPRPRCCDCCGRYYVNKSGTSMAAPHVTGVAALMLQKNPGLTAEQVRTHLMATARVPEGVDPDDLPNGDYGAGRIDAAAAVAAVPPPTPPNPLRAAEGAGTAAPSGRDAAEAGSGDTERDGSGGQPGGADAFGGGRRGGAPAAAWRRDTQEAAPLLAALHTVILAHPAGELWAADVSRHFSEVRGLVNHNLRVALAWHRMQGPALVAHLAHHVAGRPTGVILPTLPPTLSERIAAFLDALVRYGSPPLAATVRRRRAEILDLDLAAVLPVLARAAARPAA
ncbi:subtilase family protease [Frankia sp. EI5c]|uniref:S8 family peptidase n=1 Tax=Frankia sp. EI5c TaxID=683316 RepID=UPI0007C2ECA6|nr:S8 family peptidase [Frankia sp. EI5c]OAA27363.1 subtilase family protease [Frankia sp. EI5c]